MSSRSPKYNEEIVYNNLGDDSMVLGLKRLNLSQVEKDMVFMGSQNVSPGAFSTVNRSGGIQETTQLLPPDSECDGETLGHAPLMDRGHRAVDFKQAESKQMASGQQKHSKNKLNGKISQRHMPAMSPIAIGGGKSPLQSKNKIKFLAPIDTAAATPVAVKNLKFAPTTPHEIHQQSIADISPISASQPRTPINQKKMLQKFLSNSGASNAQYQSVVNNSESRTAQKQLRRFELTPVQTKNLSSSIGGRSSSLKVQLAPLNASSGAAAMVADYQNASHGNMPHQRPQKPHIAGKLGQVRPSSLDLNAQSNDYISQGLNKKSGLSNMAANPISLILNHQQISDPLALIKLNKQNNQMRHHQVLQRMRGDSQHVVMGSPVKVQDSSPSARQSKDQKAPKFQSSYKLGTFDSQLSGIQEFPQSELPLHQGNNETSNNNGAIRIEKEQQQINAQFVENELEQDISDQQQHKKVIMKGRHDITLPTIKFSSNNLQDITTAQQPLRPQFESEKTGVQTTKVTKNNNNQYDKRSQSLAIPLPSMNANFSGSRNHSVVKHQSHMPVPNQGGESYHYQHYLLQQDNFGQEHQTGSFAQLQSPTEFLAINESAASDSHQSQRINRNQPSSKTVVNDSKQINQQLFQQQKQDKEISRFRGAQNSQANNNENSDSVAVRHIVASQNKLYKKNFNDHQQLIKVGNGNLIGDDVQGSSFDKETAEHTNRASSALQNRQQQFEHYHQQQVGLNKNENVQQIRDSKDTIKQLKNSKKHNHQKSPVTPLVLTKDNINFTNQFKQLMFKSEETQVYHGQMVLRKSQVKAGSKQENNLNSQPQNSTEIDKSKKSAATGAEQQASEQYVYLSDKQIFVRVVSDQNEQTSAAPSISLQMSQQQPHIIQNRNLTKVKNGTVEVHEIFKRKKEGVNLYNAAKSNSLVDADNLAPMYVMKEHHPRRNKQQQQINHAQIRAGKHHLQSHQNNQSSNSVAPSPQQMLSKKQMAQQNQIVLNLNKKMSQFVKGHHYNSSESIGSYHKSQSGNGQQNEHALETLRIMVRGKDSAGAQSINDSFETLDKEKNNTGTASAVDLNSGGEEDGSTFRALTLNKKQPHSTRMTIGNKDLHDDLQEDKNGMSLYLINPKLGDHKPAEAPIDVLSLGPPPASGLDIISKGGNGDHNNDNSFQGGVQYITKQDGSLVLARKKSEEEQKDIPLPKKIREKMSYLKLNKNTVYTGDNYSDNESSKASKRGASKKKKQQDNKKKMKQTRDDLNPWSDQKNERIESDDEEDNLENAVQQHKMASSSDSEAASEMLALYQDEKITVSRLRSEFLSSVSKAAGSQTLLDNSNQQRSTKQKKLSTISLNKKVSVPLILNKNELADEHELVIQGDDDQDDSPQDSSGSIIENQALGSQLLGP